LFDTAARLLVNGGRLLWFGAALAGAAVPEGFHKTDVMKLLAPANSTLVVLQRVFHVEQG
jgi:hypothetical protein